MAEIITSPQLERMPKLHLARPLSPHRCVACRTDQRQPIRGAFDLRGRRHDLGMAVRDMAAGLGVGLGSLLSMEDGTASEEDKNFYRT